jgi:hypothetical protein
MTRGDRITEIIDKIIEEAKKGDINSVYLESFGDNVSQMRNVGHWLGSLLIRLDANVNDELKNDILRIARFSIVESQRL